MHRQQVICLLSKLRPSTPSYKPQTSRGRLRPSRTSDLCPHSKETRFVRTVGDAAAICASLLSVLAQPGSALGGPPAASVDPGRPASRRRPRLRRSSGVELSEFPLLSGLHRVTWEETRREDAASFIIPRPTPRRPPSFIRLRRTKLSNNEKYTK